MVSNEIIAQAIRKVLDDQRWSIKAIEGKAVPQYFWDLVLDAFPGDVPKPNKTALSNHYTKNAGKNRAEILGILRGSLPTSQPMTEDDIRSLIREEIEKLSQTDTHINKGKVVLVPEPPIGEGKEKKRQYARFSVTVDEVLMKLFRQEQKRLGVTAPRLLDTVLWERYGHPKLSFDE